MSWFDNNTILKIYQTALANGLHQKRNLLLGDIPPAFVGAIKDQDSSADQLLADLQHLNRAEEAIDGVVPFEAWLAVARNLTSLWSAASDFFAARSSELLDQKQGRERRHVHAPLGPAPASGTSASAESGCPTKAFVITNRAVFLDREPVREALRSLATPGGARFLVVKGLSRAGKSYICRFLAFLDWQGWLPVNPVRIEFDRRLASSNPAEVAQGMRDVVLEMTDQHDEMPPEWTERETLEQYAKKLARWFRDHVRVKTNTTHWVVFDGFDKQTLDSNVAEFFEQLMSHVEAPLHDCRLLFLGYGGEPPETYELLTKSCLISAPSDADVRDFLRRIGKYIGHADPDAFADEGLKQINREVAAHDASRSSEIARWCRDVAEHYQVPIGM